MSPTSASSTSSSAAAIKRRDSRGLHSATMSKNFEDELISGGTRHLKSDSVGSGQSSNGRHGRRHLTAEGSPESDEYDEGDDLVEVNEPALVSYARDQEMLVEEDEPPSPSLPPRSNHTRTPASAAYAFKQPSAQSNRTPSSKSIHLASTAEGPSPSSDGRSRTTSADTTTSLTPKPPQLPTFPSESSSVYSTASAAPETTQTIPSPPLVVPPTPTSTAARATEPRTSPSASGRGTRKTSSGSPSSYDGARVANSVATELSLGDDISAKRRSLFRGGGTASSPDLATLVSIYILLVQLRTYISTHPSCGPSVRYARRRKLELPWKVPPPLLTRCLRLSPPRRLPRRTAYHHVSGNLPIPPLHGLATGRVVGSTGSRRAARPAHGGRPPRMRSATSGSEGSTCHLERQLRTVCLESRPSVSGLATLRRRGSTRSAQQTSLADYNRVGC